MTSQVDIANRSLLSVGARTQVASINPSDGSVEANAIGVLWTPTFESLARTAQWNCLRKQQVLTLIAAAQDTPENPSGSNYPIPPTPWLYAYAYPSDCLAFRNITPSFPALTSDTAPTTINNAAGSWVPGGEGQIPFVISSWTDSNNNPIEIILTNQCQAQGVYTANLPNPALWDSLFQSAMVASLAVYLVPALSLDLPLMQLAIQTAERIIATARAADGNEGVTVMDHLPDWMQARLGGQGYGWVSFNGTYPFGSYAGMNWPSFN